MQAIEKLSSSFYKRIIERHFRAVIYGTFYESGTILRVLTMAGINVEGFIEHGIKGDKIFHSLPVYDYKDKALYENELLVFAHRQRFIQNIDSQLQREQITYVLMDEEKNLQGISWLLSIGRVPQIFRTMYKKYYNSIDAHWLVEERGESQLDEKSCTAGQYFKEISTPRLRMYKNGFWIVGNLKSRFVNVRNGERLTISKYDHYEKNIYFVGQSFIYGMGSEDKDTICSCLQKMIDEKQVNYRVHNYAAPGETFSEMLHKVKWLSLKFGDIVVISNAIFSIPEDETFKNHTIWMNTYLYFYMIENLMEYCMSIGVKLVFCKIPSVGEIHCFTNWERALKKLDFQQENKIAGRVVTTDNSTMHLSVDWELIKFLCMDKGIPYYDAIDVLDKVHKEEFYYDWLHLTPLGNKTVSNLLFKALFAAEGYIQNKSSIKRTFTAVNKTEKERYLEAYICEIKKCLPDQWEENNGGSIVMNANPFTNGHRYLIEQALSQVNWLVVFVLEADKSEFSFEERLFLVREGTKDLKNVTVVASGDYIISHHTFPEYFNKKELQNEIINATADLELFGTYIAPALNISKRFVGEEPNCNITKQYNEQMKKVLPEFGIEVIEIKRKEIETTVISASLVREFIDKGEIDNIQKLVPESTLQYLKKQKNID